MSDFATRLVRWQLQHGRHDLPWQGTRDPYRVWLSEIMLQQTQVDTVQPYYTRFLARFPDVATLAAAPLDEVLAHWSGLGYYARARNLHRAAQRVVADHCGRFPDSPDRLAALPGIGRSTAAAIAAFCFGARTAILDGNVKRVLTRHHGIEGFPGERAVEQRLWALAESLLPATRVDIYTQALMDLGAAVCARRRPQCAHCPIAGDCVARATGRQAELPTPRPPRAIPQRESDVLVLRCAATVLLQRRPESGLWGGLFVLPDLPAGMSAPDAARLYGCVPAAPALELPAVRHVFTHFRLDIRPTLVDVVAPPPAPAGHAWCALGRLDDLGLPAPVRRILDALPPVSPRV